QLEESELDLIVAGTRTAITMIEGFAREMREEEIGDAIMFAHQQVVKVIDLIEKLRTDAGLPAKEAYPAATENPLKEIFYKRFAAEVGVRKARGGKHEGATKLDEMKERLKTEFLTPKDADSEPPHTPEHVSAAFAALEERVVRELILEGQRIDGRN